MNIPKLNFSLRWNQHSSCVAEVPVLGVSVRSKKIIFFLFHSGEEAVMLRLGSFFGPLWAGKYLNSVMLICVLTCLLSETLFFMINSVKKKKIYFWVCSVDAI